MPSIGSWRSSAAWTACVLVQRARPTTEFMCQADTHSSSSIPTLVERLCLRFFSFRELTRPQAGDRARHAPGWSFAPARAAAVRGHLTDCPDPGAKRTPNRSAWPSAPGGDFSLVEAEGLSANRVLQSPDLDRGLVAQPQIRTSETARQMTQKGSRCGSTRVGRQSHQAGDDDGRKQDAQSGQQGREHLGGSIHGINVAEAYCSQ
jgi:hypothetical protein